MTSLALALLGAGVGLGVLIVMRGMRPRRVPLGTLLAPRSPGAEDVSHGPVDRLVGVAEAIGLRNRAAPADLEICGRTPQRYLVTRLLFLIIGIATPAGVAVALQLLGVGLPAGALLLLAAGSVAGGLLLPDALLRQEADQRRRSFRHAFSAYLDLVNVLLAGGAGIESSLASAAAAGDGWAYRLIRSELRRSRLTGRSPWDTFAELAARLDVAELAELAASVSLAGSHGARIRGSLAAKADTLRGHQVAQTESAAEAATERMTVPVAVLLFGFLLFIAYPAVIQITSVTGP